MRSLHSLGIVKLDIKRTNIVYSQKDDDIRIVDLGLGLIYNKITRHIPMGLFDYFRKKDLEDVEKIFK